MGWRLAGRGDALAFGTVKRLDPRFWTVNFPRPMMAAVTATAADALRVDTVFYRSDDLAGLIWEAEDVHDHPLLAYATDRDFRGCTLRFRWRSSGVRALDQVNGPTLTIEGRDASGAPRAWYVRLWNYASGSPQDAQITLDFDDLDGGFLLPAEADPVWAGDVDRMFVSLVPPAYDGAGTPLPASVRGVVELTGVRCDGPRSVLGIGEAMVPAHGLRIATGYDDLYHLTPARVLRNALHLGYRGPINHYVGMSHYCRLAWHADAGAFLVDASAAAINPPCTRWHTDFAIRAKALGYGLIWSLSYELLDMHCPADWKQRGAEGEPALTGWVPPSSLLSPAHGGAMAWLRKVGQAFVAITVAVGLPARFQIGEPWWWVRPADGHPCLYDAAATAAFGGAPVAIPTVRGTLSGAQKALLDAAGALLSESTLGLRDAVRAVAPGCEVAILVYLPTVLDGAAPALRRANVPIGWARPAFDVLQLEDYDWVTAGDRGSSARGAAAMTAWLGYPPGDQHYFSGFVLEPERAAQWAAIDAAAEIGRARGVAETFVWALPQVMRDGYVHFDGGDTAVQAFDDTLFPIALGREASVSPGFSTAVVTSAAGHEQRNADWADARLRFDAGPGVRSEADIQALIGFFRARMGAARAFRFRDPFDFSSNAMAGTPDAGDQALGSGDGVRTGFPLVKRYGEQVRAITRPVAGSVRVALGGMEQAGGWSLEGGVVTFDVAPAAGVAVTAGFLFDVPVRFAEDRLEVNRATFLAGEAPSVPLIEVREAA